jgi:hypothetical protein
MLPGKILKGQEWIVNQSEPFPWCTGPMPHDGEAGSLIQRLRPKLRAIHVLTGQAKKQTARSNFARVNRHFRALEEGLVEHLNDVTHILRGLKKNPHTGYPM